MYELAEKENQRNHCINASKDELKLRKKIRPSLHLPHVVGNQALQRLLHSSSAPQMCNAQWAAANPAAVSRSGGDAPVPIRSLTEEDRSVDLKADRFQDDKRLQAAFDNNPPIHLAETDKAAVKKLQQAFIDLGFLMPKSVDDSGEPDGIFGQETFLVVKGFQWRQGIVQDGVVGRQTMGELDGLFSGQAPPGTRTPGADQPGTAISVSTIDRSPKQFGKCGGFTWSVDWQTNARNGYLVQEIVRELEIDVCGGPPVAVETGTLHYWEAWRVQEDGGIHGTSGADDDWFNSSSGSDRLAGFPGTQGKWKITGRVFFVNQLDLKAGFKVFNVPEAGTLWSTKTKPDNLGNELLLRSEGESWKCCIGESEEGKDTEEPESDAD